MRSRILVWLIVLCAFMAPPAVVPSAAMQSGSHAMMSDCPDHPPPPAPCPDKHTAKHAAGLCCPFMAMVIAVLPASAASADPAQFADNVARVSRDLTGLSPHQDPPPPRV